MLVENWRIVLHRFQLDFLFVFQVAAYLMMRKGMTSAEALETIRQSRPIRPNPGFLQQLADHENLLSKKLVWS